MRSEISSISRPGENRDGREEEERDSSVYDSEEEARRLQPPKKKKAMAGASTYRMKFKDE